MKSVCFAGNILVHCSWLLIGLQPLPFSLWSWCENGMIYIEVNGKVGIPLRWIIWDYFKNSFSSFLPLRGIGGPKRTKICVCSAAIIFHHGFIWPAGCLWASLSLFWGVLHTSYCLWTDWQSKPLMPLAVLLLLWTGSKGLSCNLVNFLSPTSGW